MFFWFKIVIVFVELSVNMCGDTSPASSPRLKYWKQSEGPVIRDQWSSWRLVHTKEHYCVPRLTAAHDVILTETSRKWNLKYSLLMVIMFYKVVMDTESVNTESSLLRNTGLQSWGPLVIACSSIDQFSALLYVCFCSKTLYLICLFDPLT